MSPKEHNNLLAMGPKGRKTNKLCDKEFKQMITRKFNDIQENKNIN